MYPYLQDVQHSPVLKYMKACMAKWYSHENSINAIILIYMKAGKKYTKAREQRAINSYRAVLIGKGRRDRRPQSGPSKYRGPKATRQPIKTLRVEGRKVSQHLTMILQP